MGHRHKGTYEIRYYHKILPTSSTLYFIMECREKTKNMINLTVKHQQPLERDAAIASQVTEDSKVGTS